jgi:hypothetical protein
MITEIVTNFEFKYYFIDYVFCSVSIDETRREIPPATSASGGGRWPAPLTKGG